MAALFVGAHINGTQASGSEPEVSGSSLPVTETGD
jgi:hypothetical protein